MYGTKQPSRRFRFRIALPQHTDFCSIDQELAQCFEVQLEPLRTLVTPASGGADEIALEFTWRAMLLARKLLHAIKIPSFDPGLILGLASDPKLIDKYSVAILLPSIEDISADWTAKCMRLAYRVLFEFANPHRQEAAIAAMLDELHDKFIDPAKGQNPGGESTIAVLEAAFRLDIPFFHLGSGLYQLGWGANAKISDRSSCEFDSAFGAHASHNKQTAARLLRKAGLPAPDHVLVRDVEQALDAASHLAFPVVIKPADKDRSEGVTVGVTTADGVRTAFEVASKVSSHVLVERQVAGTCHRIVVIGNQAPYTVARYPKLLYGDGMRSVREIISTDNAFEEHKAKHLRKRPLPADESTDAFLAEQGVGLDTVLAAGQRVFLRRIENSEWGGTPELVNELIHPENLRIAIQAARMLRLRIAGVDLISPDISRPWYENGAVINEVNFAPFIGNYYDYQRDSLDLFVRGLFERNSRIPVEVFVGDDQAIAAAQARQRAWSMQNVAAFVTSHQWTFGQTSEVTFAAGSDRLFGRCQNLLMNTDVEALLIVIQTDEFLASGLPVDRINQVNIINLNLQSYLDTTLPAEPNNVDRVQALLRDYLQR